MTLCRGMGREGETVAGSGIRTYPDRLSVVSVLRLTDFDHLECHPSDLVGVRLALLV